MKFIIQLITVLIIFNTSIAQVKDIDGNKYQTTNIGTQVWMSENLNTTKFSNGDIILKATSKEEWDKAAQSKQAAWAYIFFNDDYEKYGKFYNWYALVDERGLAPKGWKIPSDEDWDLMANRIAGAKLKSTEGWKIGDVQNTSYNAYDPNSPQKVQVNGNGNNSTGFNAMPNSEYSFNSWDRTVTQQASFWVITEQNEYNGKIKILRWINHDILTTVSSKSNGHKVRCLKE